METKYKHLTPEEREEIQEGLNHGMTFKAIGKRIGKDPTTISKEIKKHIYYHKNSYTTSEECCPLLKKAPFVCNGCKKRSASSCHYVKHLYRAVNAQNEYRETLVESREGVPFTKETFYQVEQIVTDGIKKGQHIYHILQSNSIPYGTSTIYNYINQGYYQSVRRIDLPRAVKFKPRKKNKEDYVPKSVKKGRTYEDFEAFCEDHPEYQHIEMDTVIGRVGGKVLLTLHFTSNNFMIGLLLEDKTSVQVSEKITALKKRLADNGFSFGKLMPVILTDNGGEFSNVAVIENDFMGDKETAVFFCHPHTPSEKPKVEKNHTIFRDILPKGTSFDELTQDKVNVIFSHVNAVKRSIFNGKSPYDLFSFMYSEELANILGISFVAPNDVIQSPKLLKFLP